MNKFIFCLIVAAVLGCSNNSSKAPNPINVQSGVLKEVVPISADNYDSHLLIQLSDGRSFLVYVNRYDYGKHIFPIGSYVDIAVNDGGYLTSIQIPNEVKAVKP